MLKFCETTAFCEQGLAEHKDELGAPLCPCRHYDDKVAEAQQGFWNCPCVPMRERKARSMPSFVMRGLSPSCHCLHEHVITELRKVVIAAFPCRAACRWQQRLSICLNLMAIDLLCPHHAQSLTLKTSADCAVSWRRSAIACFS